MPGPTTYLEKLLHDYSMWKEIPAATLLFYWKTPWGSFQRLSSYRGLTPAISVCDGIFYVPMLGMSLDFAYAVSVINRYPSNLTQTHCKTVKRFLKYFKNTLTLQFTFRISLLLLPTNRVAFDVSKLLKKGKGVLVIRSGRRLIGLYVLFWCIAFFPLTCTCLPSWPRPPYSHESCLLHQSCFCITASIFIQNRLINLCERMKS